MTRRIANWLLNTSLRGCLFYIILLIIVLFFLFYLRAYEKQADQPPEMSIRLADDGTPAATLAAGESPLPTVTPVVLSTPIPSLCQPGIQVGKTINVVYPQVRMRYSPGYVSKNDVVDTKHYLQMGDQVTVMSGPEINDELCWWYIQHQQWEGWTADHSHQGRLLLSAGP
jgi:hypothetical protein